MLSSNVRMRQNIQIDIYVFEFLFWKEEEQGNVGYDAWHQWSFHQK